jgi:hypothetical protein
MSFFYCELIDFRNDKLGGSLHLLNFSNCHGPGSLAINNGEEAFVVLFPNRAHLSTYAETVCVEKYWRRSSALAEQSARTANPAKVWR